MSCQIVWTRRASLEYEDLIDYLIHNWGLSVAKKFDIEVESILGSIQKFPGMHSETDIRKDVRRCVVSKQTSLYYRVSADNVELLSFWSNRKNPQDLKIEV